MNKYMFDNFLWDVTNRHPSFTLTVHDKMMSVNARNNFLENLKHTKSEYAVLYEAKIKLSYFEAKKTYSLIREQFFGEWFTQNFSVVDNKIFFDTSIYVQRFAAEFDYLPQALYGITKSTLEAQLAMLEEHCFINIADQHEMWQNQYNHTQNLKTTIEHYNWYLPETSEDYNQLIINLTEAVNNLESSESVKQHIETEQGRQLNDMLQDLKPTNPENMQHNNQIFDEIAKFVARKEQDWMNWTVIFEWQTTKTRLAVIQKFKHMYQSNAEVSHDNLESFEYTTSPAVPDSNWSTVIDTLDASFFKNLRYLIRDKLPKHLREFKTVQHNQGTPQDAKMNCLYVLICMIHEMVLFKFDIWSYALYSRATEGSLSLGEKFGLDPRLNFFLQYWNDYKFLQSNSRIILDSMNKQFEYYDVLDKFMKEWSWPKRLAQCADVVCERFNQMNQTTMALTRKNMKHICYAYTHTFLIGRPDWGRGTIALDPLHMLLTTCSASEKKYFYAKKNYSKFLYFQSKHAFFEKQLHITNFNVFAAATTQDGNEITMGEKIEALFKKMQNSKPDLQGLLEQELLQSDDFNLHEWLLDKNWTSRVSETDAQHILESIDFIIDVSRRNHYYSSRLIDDKYHDDVKTVRELKSESKWDPPNPDGPAEGMQLVWLVTDYRGYGKSFMPACKRSQYSWFDKYQTKLELSAEDKVDKINYVHYEEDDLDYDKMFCTDLNIVTFAQAQDKHLHATKLNVLRATIEELAKCQHRKMTRLLSSLKNHMTDVDIVLLDAWLFYLSHVQVKLIADKALKSVDVLWVLEKKMLASKMSAESDYDANSVQPRDESDQISQTRNVQQSCHQFIKKMLEDQDHDVFAKLYDDLHVLENLQQSISEI